MTESYPPRLLREAALRELEPRLAADPHNVDLRRDRAALLTELGQLHDARDAYLDVLARNPSDRLALNNLGTLLYSTGYRSAAQTAYAEAVARHPEDAMGHVNLANLLYENHESERAREHYEAALRCDPEHAEAHQGLSYVLADSGDAERALWHRRRGFEHRAVRTLPYRGKDQPVSVLLLISASGGNIPTRNLLDDRIFETTVLAPEFYDLKQPLPAHQLIFNSIGDADLAGAALVSAQSVAALSSAPVLNPPAAVMATGRAQNAQRLSRLPHVIAPVTINLALETLLTRHGLNFPLLLRTPGFHTGRHFVRVESPESLAEAAAGLPGAELTVIQYLDARGADGKARKYRVMMIDGELYPLHLAISADWKIHYFTAEMAGSAENRAEDAEFLANMPRVLGARSMAALREIQAVLGLDYAGIDFGLSPAGDLLLFEANATMVVNPPEPDQRWAYRRPAVERIFAAVKRMLLRKASGEERSAR